MSFISFYTTLSETRRREMETPMINEPLRCALEQYSAFCRFDDVSKQVLIADVESLSEAFRHGKSKQNNDRIDEKCAIT